MTAEEALDILDDLDAQARLSEWEIEFVDSMMHRCATGVPPTPGQAAKLLEIAEAKGAR